MFRGIASILNGAIALLAVAALVGIAFTYSQDVKLKSTATAHAAAAQAQAEQEVAIYKSLIAASDGLGLPALAAGASDDTALAAVLNLIAKGAVERQADGTFRAIATRPDRENPFERSARLAEAIIAHVAESPDGYTLAELKAWLMSEHKLSQLEAASALRPLIPASLANMPVLSPANVLTPAVLPEPKLKVVQ